MNKRVIGEGDEGMLCPDCNAKSHILNTAFKKGFTIRYRQCNKCEKHFTTREELSQGIDYKGLVKKMKDLLKDVK